jgi:hypothetical protein
MRVMRSLFVFSFWLTEFLFIYLTERDRREFFIIIGTRCFSRTHSHVPGHLWILTSDFSTELTNFLTRAPHAPLQVEWCGGDAIACYWETQMEHLVLLVGPDASYRPLKFDQPLVLSSECDGIRIIGQGESGFITKISSM